MKNTLSLLCTLALLAPSFVAHAQQRIEFQRQKFDRSRFERPDPAMRPAAPQPTPKSPEPASPPFDSQPMAPTAPAADAPEFKFSDITATPAPPPPAAQAVNAYAPPGITPEEQALIDQPQFDLVPGKWFTSPKDFPKLLDLQVQSGTCMLVYFNNQGDSSQKGLCNWFEKRTTTDMGWRKAMKYYLKLKIFLPGNKDARELVEQFRVNKTPAIFVVKPHAKFYDRLQVFEFPVGDRPIPIEPAVVLESLKKASTPAYNDQF